MSPTLWRGCSQGTTRPKALSLKHRLWPVGARWQGLNQGGGVSLSTDPHDLYRKPYPQGLDFTDALRGYQSLRHFHKHLVVNYFKEFSIKELRTISTVSRVLGAVQNKFCTTIGVFLGTTFRCI